MKKATVKKEKTTHDGTVEKLLSEGWTIESTGSFGMNNAGGRMKRYRYTNMVKGKKRVTVNFRGGIGGFVAGANNTLNYVRFAI